MARNFNLLYGLNDESMNEKAKTEALVWVNIYDIEPHIHNFFRMDTNINGLKDSIREKGVNNAVQIVRNGGGEKKKYTMYEGHRRLKACMELVEEEGLEKFKYIKAEISDRKNSLEEIEQIVTSNTSARNLNGWEMMMSCVMLDDEYKEAKKRGELVLKPDERSIVDKIAHTISRGSSQVGNYLFIGRHLQERLMEAFADDKITVELALKAAHLEPDEQLKLAELVEECGTITINDINSIIDKKIIEGQQSFFDEDIPVTGMKPDEAEDIPVTGIKSNEAEDIPVTGIKSNEAEDIPVTGTNYERGLYRLEMVDDMIAEYEDRLRTAHFTNDRSNDEEYYCVLDALRLLKSSIG